VPGGRLHVHALRALGCHETAARYLCVLSNPCLQQPRSLRACAAQGAAEGRKKPVKAKLGEKNTMFYDEAVRPGPGAPCACRGPLPGAGGASA